MTALMLLLLSIAFVLSTDPRVTNLGVFEGPSASDGWRPMMVTIFMIIAVLVAAAAH